MSNLTGTTLGPYRILERIGQGGMGTVYKAYRSGMDRLVAIKVVSAVWDDNPILSERFRQETRLITKLEHRAIVPVYDVGEYKDFLYLVMRYLQAGTVRDILQRGPLPLADAARLIAEVASALDYAHASGIIHRDVKPSNILIDKQGHAYLTDFGMAKSMMTSAEITRTGDSVGTPAYMAPEQSMGRAVSPQTDIYALGVMLYEMATGRVPFQSEMPIVQAMMHVHSTPPAPRSINPEVSEEVEWVILKSLEKNPLGRFDSAGKLAHTLNLAIEHSAARTPNPVPPDLILSQRAGAIAAGKDAEEITPNLRRELQRHEQRERWLNLRRPVLIAGLSVLVVALLFCLGLAGNEILRGRASAAQTATAITGLFNQLGQAQTLAASGGGGDQIEATVHYLQTEIALGLATATASLTTHQVTATPTLTMSALPPHTPTPSLTVRATRTPGRSATASATLGSVTTTPSHTATGSSGLTDTPSPTVIIRATVATHTLTPAPTLPVSTSTPTVTQVPTTTATDPVPTATDTVPAPTATDTVPVPTATRTSPAPCSSNPQSPNYCTPTPAGPAP